MNVSVRAKALDMSGLAAAESHGKRQDQSSALRRINENPPIVAGGLDLRALYDQHVSGARMNSGAKKPVLHMIVRMPPELLEGDGSGPFVGSLVQRQKEMLRQAIIWANEAHGGEAVFAARLDRDEEGQAICDLFLAPRYRKETKRRKGADAELWVSATKFGRELAVKHQDEIRRRHSGAKPGNLTSPRAVGIALQSDFRAWFEARNGITLRPKVEKGSTAPDRLEIEAMKRVREAEAKVAAREAEAERVMREAEAAHAQGMAMRAEAMAMHTDAMENQRAAEQDRAEAMAMRDEAMALRSRLAGLLDRVARWLRRPDLPQVARADADAIMRDAGRASVRPDAQSGGRSISEIRSFGRGSAPRPPAPDLAHDLGDEDFSLG